MLAECIKSSSFPLAIAFALFFIKDSYKTFRSPENLLHLNRERWRIWF